MRNCRVGDGVRYEGPKWVERSQGPKPQPTLRPPQPALSDSSA